MFQIKRRALRKENGKLPALRLSSRTVFAAEDVDVRPGFFSMRSIHD